MEVFLFLFLLVYIYSFRYISLQGAKVIEDLITCFVETPKVIEDLIIWIERESDLGVTN